MIKILDVSNSNKRPLHRGLCGPIENDIVRYLKKYAHKFNFEFVNDEKQADIIFTNDVFPKIYQKPKLKRMDGVYNQKELLVRNDILNNSAQQADIIVFISNFSKISLEKLYPNIKVKSSLVALNCVDNEEFYNLNLVKQYDFISTANSWSRPEKRGEYFPKIAQHFNKSKFALIGNSEQLNCSNIDILGYVNNYKKLNELLNLSKSFLYLGFNDPAPKTVCQSLNCNLPLFLTNSGGNFELANNYAYFINDKVKINEPIIVESIPDLNLDSIIYHLENYIKNQNDYNYNYPAKEKFEEMLTQYFKAFKILI